MIRMYYEAEYEMAGLNHRKGICEANLGWTRGVLVDGVPFEAELWIEDGEWNLCVIIPEIFEIEEKKTIGGAFDIGLNIGDKVCADTLLKFKEFQDENEQ